MAPPRLWSWHVSPFAGKVRIALAAKGVEVELVEIDPRSRPARLRELNPTGRVPVLEVGGVAIRESTAICEWLEETVPDPPLWPTDPLARAVARGMLRWVDEELTTNFFVSMRKEAFGLERGDPPEVVAIMRERLMRRWPVLDELLARTEGPWMLAGDGPTLIDLAAIPLAVRLPRWKAELAPPADLAHANAWLAMLREHPGAAEVDRRGGPIDNSD